VRQDLDDRGNVVVYEDCHCNATVDDFRPCEVHEPEGDLQEFHARRERFLEAAAKAQETYNRQGAARCDESGTPLGV
jgi:hypothetical protein